MEHIRSIIHKACSNASVCLLLCILLGLVFVLASTLIEVLFAFLFTLVILVTARNATVTPLLRLAFGLLDIFFNLLLSVFGTLEEI